MKNPIVLFSILMTAILLSLGAAAQDSLRTATITVSNLHCNNDMPAIKKQLQNQEGIEEISFTEIRGGRSVFTISYHSIATTQAQIEQAIESTPGCEDKDSRPYKVKKAQAAKKKKR